ncbi:hypothetical protein [Burkholderia lata]|uniref:hypothetical protein n=1 Tax=Burkholderia lata (strain ATCC 17760 / DSM 23089 / LMG 22485 / NCIMB 9086 / R18194 / 383) TaxID=482957 RepID=UPI0015843860|nr:hypothetical protein [Burkholderia lata]
MDAVFDDCACAGRAAYPRRRARIATPSQRATVYHALGSSVVYLIADHGRLDLGEIRLVPNDEVVVHDESRLGLLARDDTDVVIAELWR